MTTAIKQAYRVKGLAFGARGCPPGCDCDPCDCDPCECGEGMPDWRVSGFAVSMGHMQAIDLSGLVILSLSLPLNEARDRWQEMIVVEEQATTEQVAALLAIFESQLSSIPAEVGEQFITERAVYTAPITCSKVGEQITLDVSLHTDDQEWSYHGPMAMRSPFDLNSDQ